MTAAAAPLEEGCEQTMKLPLLPNGASVHIDQLALGVVGGTVWPAARTLCEHLLDSKKPGGASSVCSSLLPGAQPQRIAVVEVGSGTGAVGIFAAAAFADWKVTLTEHRPPVEAVISSVPYLPDGTLDSMILPTEDFSEEERPRRRTSDRLLRLLHDNLDHNRALFRDPETAPTIMELDWTKPEHIEQVKAASIVASKNGGFDLVLASDVTYQSVLHDALACTMVRLMRNDVGKNGCGSSFASPAMCLVAHQERVLNHRGQDCQLISFEKAAKRVGLSVFQRHEKTVLDDWGHEQRIAILELRRSRESDDA
jgi:predicted nicotinamide N-methyase